MGYENDPTKNDKVKIRGFDYYQDNEGELEIQRQILKYLKMKKAFRKNIADDPINGRHMYIPSPTSSVN